MATIAEVNALCADTYMPYLTTNFGSESIGTKILFGKGKKLSGGPMIRQTPLYQYTKGGPFVRGTVFDTSGEENALGLGLSWRYYYFPATLFLQDIVENNGPMQIHDILNVRMTAMKRGAQERISNDLFNGAAVTIGGVSCGGGNDSSTIINSLDNALDSGTVLQSSATYAGVAKGTYTWFAGNTTTISGSGALSIAAINEALFSAVDGGISPDLILTSPRAVMKYQNLEWAKQQYVNLSQQDPLVAGFALKTFHNGIPMVADNHIPGSTTESTNRMYFLNTSPEFFNFFVHNEWNFKMRPWMEPYDQGAQTTQIILACNLLVGDPNRHAVLYAFSLD